jgi:hypothetical protein
MNKPAGVLNCPSAVPKEPMVSARRSRVCGTSAAAPSGATTGRRRTRPISRKWKRDSSMGTAGLSFRVRDACPSIPFGSIDISRQECAR